MSAHQEKEKQILIYHENNTNINNNYLFCTFRWFNNMPQRAAIPICVAFFEKGVLGPVHTELLVIALALPKQTNG